MNEMTIAQVKETIRAPYAWPGGYRILFLMSDGETILPGTACKNFREVVQDMNDGCGDWQIAGSYIYNEGGPIFDAHTNEQIDSEYGPVE